MGRSVVRAPLCALCTFNVDLLCDRRHDDWDAQSRLDDAHGVIAVLRLHAVIWAVEIYT
jgi:hypothetical protein